MIDFLSAMLVFADEFVVLDRHCKQEDIVIFLTEMIVAGALYHPGGLATAVVVQPNQRPSRFNGSAIVLSVPQQRATQLNLNLRTQ